MAPVQVGKVLVSGANGYIATWIVQTLLEKGFSVRGAVRSADKGNHLLELFGTKYPGKFETVVIPDITSDGAFDVAVKGVVAIEHTASPFYLNANDPAELSEPAIKGTIGSWRVLGNMDTSTVSHSESVKRIVVTSSCAAIARTSDRVLTELDWNDDAVDEVQAKGIKASPGAKYFNSKVFAERAAWKFVEEEYAAHLSWDLCVMNPPLVLGPVIHAVASPEALNTSAKRMYDLYTKPGEVARGGGGNWVDVRDVALAHVLALQRELPVGGERNRFIICSGAFARQDWLDAAPPSSKYEKGTPGAGKDFVPVHRYDNAKALRVLNEGVTDEASRFAYRSMHDTATATIADYERRKW
ncbi:D-lactaldehyde dehydrogenase [Mycena galericulata]|nr:D-lactaldehyde dehydrogenase [Mycena galericulata]